MNYIVKVIEPVWMESILCVDVPQDVIDSDDEYAIHTYIDEARAAGDYQTLDEPHDIGNIAMFDSEVSFKPEGS